jgi:hypothetical protein
MQVGITYSCNGCLIFWQQQMGRLAQNLDNL